MADLRLILVVCAAVIVGIVVAPIDGQLFGDFLALDEFGKSTSALARLRGYIAEDHFVTTDDGYILNVVRVTNPKINNGKSGLPNKQIILFIHGTLAYANCFLVNSLGSTPQDYSHINVTELGKEGLERLLKHDKGRNSLAITALNFGHEIWLLNRRGVPQSMARVDGSSGDQILPLRGKKEQIEKVESILDNVDLNLSNLTRSSIPNFNPLQTLVDAGNDLIESVSGAINTDYWKFSMDEQAKYDIPATVDYIREAVGGRKISVVAHSAGGATILMALTNEPEIADKFDQVILWSPALDLGHTLQEHLKYKIVGPAFVPYIGPIPPPITVPVIQGVVGAYCANIIIRNTICSLVFDLVTGPGGYHRDIQPGFLSAFLTPVSSRELAQLGQSSNFKMMHHFDFEDPKKNMIAYGSTQPPLYNVTKIRLNTISFWVGEYDGLVSPPDVEVIRTRLSVNSELNVVTTGFFNHVSYFIDDNLLSILTIPNLMILEK